MVDGSGTITINTKVWEAVNEISQYIHAEDGRPTTTALTGTWDVTINQIKTYASDLDLISINAYDPGVYNVHSSLKETQQFSKPYIISEFGPLGTWETDVPKTSWGSMIEPTGSKKAEDYKKIYNEAILAHAGEGCLGSYVFLWGYQSHGDVLTWYALFDQFQKQALPAATAMSELWGATVTKHNPVITGMTLEGKTAEQNIQIPSAQTASASVVANSPDGAELTYEWKIVRDERQDAGRLMSGLTGLIQGKPDQNLSFTAPSSVGNYRLIVYARDAASNLGDVAVIPFQVSDSGTGGGVDLEEGDLGGEAIDGWEKGNHIK